jgi:hypothetical protein
MKLGDFHTGTKLFHNSFWAVILAYWHSVTSSRFFMGILLSNVLHFKYCAFFKI